MISIHGNGKHKDDILTYGVTKDILNDYDEYIHFIKGCESMVRKDDRYTHYVGKIRNAGFNHCAILGKMDDPEVTLEMHHGPIFNLFDICDIVAKAMIKRAKKDQAITTYEVADTVLCEHEKDHIQVVMLSKTAHKGNHNNSRGIFVNIKATFGRIDKFIDDWQDGMESEHYQYIEKYIAECKKAKGSIDNGLFDTAERLMEFN